MTSTEIDVEHVTRPAATSRAGILSVLLAPPDAGINNRQRELKDDYLRLVQPVLVLLE
jgi:hypothetical protein